MFGIPNVGKSSFINRISKKKSAQVGNKPGVTKQKQWIRIENNIELLDTPGILWPKFESQQISLNLAYTGTIKSEILDEYSIAFQLMQFLYDSYRENIINRYSITEKNIEEINSEKIESDKTLKLLEIIGTKRGALVSGGKIDETKISNIILEDFRSGKLGRITLEKVKEQK